MQKQFAAAAQKIGKTVRDARLDAGYETRTSFLETAKMKKKLTEEGLRKIENGERVPRLRNLRLLCAALGLPHNETKGLEDLALRTNLERAAHQAGNEKCVVRVTGKTVSVRPDRAQLQEEEFARKSVNELIELITSMGGFSTEEAETYFRRHARHVLLANLKP